jgi:hypothetical protein
VHWTSSYRCKQQRQVQSIKPNQRPINQGQQRRRETRRLGTIFIMAVSDDHRLTFESGPKIETQRVEFEFITSQSEALNILPCMEQQTSQIKENY